MPNLLLDLFCGAGGAAAGYREAGFRVVGVDHRPQPHYAGDDFVHADAWDFLAKSAHKFDAIHASPPCQHYSVLTSLAGTREKAPDFIARLRAWLHFYEKPYVIENVPGAPMRSPLILCGTMFDLDLYRHRLFECSFSVKRPAHPLHKVRAVHPDHWKPGLIMSVVGNASPVEQARKAMGIDWMTGPELAQAIPPAYTAYVGDALRRHLDREQRRARGIPA